MVPTLIGGCVLELGIALAAVVNVPATPENVPILVVMGMACVDAALVLICGLHGLADVHEKSKKINHAHRLNMPALKSRTERKWTEQFIKSCGAIKLKFGGNNFVEKLTPINCISHAFQIAVQIMLLVRNQ